MSQSIDKFWSSIVEVVKSRKLRCRLKLANSDEYTNWSDWLTEPVPSCLEVQHYGPVEKQNIEEIEIDSLKVIKLGRLAGNRKMDHSEELVSDLQDRGINFRRIDSIFVAGKKK